MEKKILEGKDLEKFKEIQKNLRQINWKEQDLRRELRCMGLEFDIYGKPKNFVIKEE